MRPADSGFRLRHQQQTILILQQLGTGVQNMAASFTVAILAQGTSWAVAVTQAFLLPGSILVGRGWRTVNGAFRVQYVCCSKHLRALGSQGGGQQVRNWV